MQILVVDQFGTFVGKESERVQIRPKNQPLQEYPFFDVERIVISSPGVSLSASLIEECTKRGIAIDFLTPSGRPYARLSSPELTGTVKTRREQILAYLDHRGLEFARSIVEGKLSNQQSILKYFARYRKERDPQTYTRIYKTVSEIKELINQIRKDEGAQTVDEDRERLISIEARAGKVYWTVFTELVPGEVDFEGREQRGASDPVNSLLNYGYGMLYLQVWGAIELAGLDPFAGFLHVDRAGKPSLVLDLVEEFRQQVVDRTVFGLINRGYKPELIDGKLSEPTRKEFAHKILARLNSEERFEGKAHKIRTIIQLQARHLAMFFRGERGYKPWVGSW